MRTSFKRNKLAHLVLFAIAAITFLHILRDRVKPAETCKILDPHNVTDTSLYVEAILQHTKIAFDNLTCGEPSDERYASLKGRSSDRARTAAPRYFIALDLHQSREIIARLLSSIFEVVKYLSPNSCVISILEGRSTDGTYDILLAIQREFQLRNLDFHLVKNDQINPEAESVDRFEALAQLRNQALEPLLRNFSQYADDTVVIFSNDVALCPNDILELLYQRNFQNADLACAMDYSGAGLFYDIWIARGMTGDIFFEIPPSGLWENAKNLLWNDNLAKRRLQAKKPFQVYACWNGIVSFTAKVLREGIRFHSSGEGECLMGEPTIFCRDLWNKGFGRIMVVPSVWVAYDGPSIQKVKQLEGYVEQIVHNLVPGSEDEKELIDWNSSAPPEVKCLIPSMADPTWVNSTTFAMNSS